MANYDANKKANQLDVLTTLSDADVIVIGDTTDNGKAKVITKSDMKTQMESGLVKATVTDTTPDTLDAKIEITSLDNSVTIIKTIQNAGTDEKISYDLSAIGGGGGSGGDTVLTFSAQGDTLSLTTLAGDIVTVWAKGTLASGDEAIELKYNGVVKDTVDVTNDTAFALEYTETPGAATHDITVEPTSTGTLADVVIIAQITRAADAPSYASVSSSIDTTTSPIPWDTEIIDTTGYHSTVSNTSRLTIPETGIYQVSATIALNVTQAADRCKVQLRLNGTTIIAQSGGIVNTLNDGGFSINGIFSFTATDYIEMLQSNNSGGTSTTIGVGSVFSILKIS